jgi:hypothetical protein
MTKLANNFKINSSDLVFFFHYMPSIFQLHLHCCLRTNSHATDVPRYIYYYEIVLDKIKKDTQYWNNATMTYSMSANHQMCIELYLK